MKLSYVYRSYCSRRFSSHLIRLNLHQPLLYTLLYRTKNLAWFLAWFGIDCVTKQFNSNGVIFSHVSGFDLGLWRLFNHLKGDVYRHTDGVASLNYPLKSFGMWFAPNFPLLHSIFSFHKHAKPWNGIFCSFKSSMSTLHKLPCSRELGFCNEDLKGVQWISGQFLF